jgi:ATP-dependent DNA helicase RecQ
MNSNEIDIHKELKKYFGFSQFKGLQEQVIQSLLQTEYICNYAYRRWKSLCYQPL